MFVGPSIAISKVLRWSLVQEALLKHGVVSFSGIARMPCGESSTSEKKGKWKLVEKVR